jgi:hypothetical protein
MASIRTITAPGTQINEIDRSQYNIKTDYSISRSPNIFVCGFADEGEDYTVQWINSLQTLNDTYGTPKNEPERYFYNACVEILNRSSTVLAAKLPYFNPAKDHFTYVDYKINDYAIGSIQSQLSTLDSTLIDGIITVSCHTISDDNGQMRGGGKIPLSTLDNYRTGNDRPSIDTIRIVNLKNNKYEALTANCIKTNLTALHEGSSILLNDEKNDEIYTNECLGYVPIIVSPVNALYFQYLLNKDSSKISDYNCITSFTPVIPNPVSYNVKVNESDAVFYKKTDINLDKNFDNVILNNLSFKIASDDKDDYTLSKELMGLFPEINYVSDRDLDRQYLKQIGIVVVKLSLDKTNNSKITYSIVESFLGSLDKTAKNIITNESIYIDNVVNNSSQYINVFSNIDYSLIKNANIIYTNPSKCVSLGFYNADCIKKINYNESIIKALNYIFDSIQDYNTIIINLIIDAGISNIAQYIQSNYGEIFDINKFVDLDNIHWNINADNLIYWKTIINKFDNFCKITRKDCMFLADGPRPFCLEGQQKIVRKTKPTNTIQKDILPKLQFMNVVNSSYTAGYCNWFLGYDAYSKTPFWYPPSIKAVGVYCNCDNYYHSWDAPAGLIRGKVSDDIYDIAFNPNENDCGKIYTTSWNYALSFPINGIVIEGQRTFQTNKTALDRVNVRRLMLYLEKSVRNLSKYFLYEQNTAYTRQRFVDMINPVFEQAQNAGGISQYVILCDDTNNTTQTIENNELHCTIAVKPIKSIEFIVINLIATSQSANVFEEVLR